MPAGKPRKPCYGCGGEKEPGERRRYCDSCTKDREEGHGVTRRLTGELQTDEERRAAARVRALTWAHDPIRRPPRKPCGRCGAPHEGPRKPGPYHCATCRQAMQEEHEAETRAWKQAQREAMQDPDLVSWRGIISRDPCAYCGATYEEADHIVALQRGGADAWTNLTAACHRCNRAKWAHSLLHFLLRVAPAH